MRNNISLLVGIHNNLDYTKHFYQTTRKLYPDIEICFVSYGSTDGTHEWLDMLNDANVKYFYSIESTTFSDTFNKAAEIATKEYVMYMHNDIVITTNFIENIEKWVDENTIVSYTTIEPPIFAGYERPGKIICDFGRDLKSFELGNLYYFSALRQSQSKDKIIDDISFFMCMPKKIYEQIGGLDNLYNPMFCEDIDLCVRFKLLGMKFIMALDAICYHFVSKTSRFSDEYKNKTSEFELHSNMNFVRKWGVMTAPIKLMSPKKYDIGFVIRNCSPLHICMFEPFCSNLYIDCDYSQYIQMEQSNTKFNLSERILPYDSEKTNDIIVDIDFNKITNDNYKTMQKISEIITDSGEIGEFELDIFKISIRSLEFEQPIYNK